MMVMAKRGSEGRGYRFTKIIRAPGGIILWVAAAFPAANIIPVGCHRSKG